MKINTRKHASPITAEADFYGERLSRDEIQYPDLSVVNSLIKIKVVRSLGQKLITSRLP
jgi:hypothetical protein